MLSSPIVFFIPPNTPLVLLRSSCSLWCTDLETIREFACNMLQVPHSSSACGLSSLCLLTPFVCRIILVSEISLSPPTASLAEFVVVVIVGCNVHFLVLAAGYPHEAQVCF